MSWFVIFLSRIATKKVTIHDKKNHESWLFLLVRDGPESVFVFWVFPYKIKLTCMLSILTSKQQSEFEQQLQSKYAPNNSCGICRTKVHDTIVQDTQLESQADFPQKIMKGPRLDLRCKERAFTLLGRFPAAFRWLCCLPRSGRKSHLSVSANIYFQVCTRGRVFFYRVFYAVSFFPDVPPPQFFFFF